MPIAAASDLDEVNAPPILVKYMRAEVSKVKIPTDCGKRVLHCELCVRRKFHDPRYLRTHHERFHMNKFCGTPSTMMMRLANSLYDQDELQDQASTLMVRSAPAPARDRNYIKRSIATIRTWNANDPNLDAL